MLAKTLVKRILLAGILGGATFFLYAQFFTYPPAPEQTEIAPLGLKIIKLAPRDYTVSIEYNPEPKTVVNWSAGGDEVVINGGYFHDDYSPSGMLIVSSTRIGDRMFDEDKSGLVVINDGKLSIRNLATHPLKTNERFHYALQSFPFIITESKPALFRDTGNRARRTALGVDNEKNMYIITENRLVSLYEFMQELLLTNVPFVEVLNLDGGPSTGIYSSLAEEYMLDSYSPVPSIIRFKAYREALNSGLQR